MRRLTLALALAGLAALPASAKTLVYCSEGNPESLNPQIVTTTTAMDVTRPVFNTLVDFAPGSTVVVPALAESWSVSEDGREYTFRLRRGVRFQSNEIFKPTRDMNADDVLFSLMRQWKTDHPYHRVSGVRYDYFLDLGMADILSAIDKVDPYTVRFRLARPDAVFLANIAMPFNAIHSAEYADAMLRAGTPEIVDQKPIGTGPFALVSYQRDMTIRFQRFTDYWGDPQPIDTLVFAITPNPAVRLTKLRSGECHLMAFPNPADVGKIAADPSLVLLKKEELNIGYLAMNTTKKPFDDVRVRRAVNMAIDKVAIIEAVYQGAGVVAKNPIPPTLWSYNHAITDYPLDVNEAQRLLVEAGYPDGFEMDLWYMPISRPYISNGKRVAEMIQADLAKIGIKLRLVTEEWSQYRTRLQAGDTSLALYGWTGDNGDPDNFFHVLLGCLAARPGGNNVSKWCNRDYDDVVNRAKLVQERQERENLYRQAQVVFHDQAPWVPLAHSVVFMATRRGVTGFQMDPLGRHIFEGVDINP